MATGKSIHIGLNAVDPNAYGGWRGQLYGCVNDANAMKAIADSLGYVSKTLITAQATSVAVLREIEGAARTLQAGDILLVSYSGHGGQVDDANNDEPDAKDETWVLYDRQVVDDELYALWSQFGPGVRILVVSDSCHSGTVAKMQMAGDLRVARRYRRSRAAETDVSSRAGATPPYNREQTTDASARAAAIPPYNRDEPTDAESLAPEDTPKAIPREVEKANNDANRDMYNTVQYIAGSRRDAEVQASVLLIAGCQDNQYSYDGNQYGQFTGRLLAVWNNGQFKGTYQSFYQKIKEGMPPEQTPNYFTTGGADPAFEQQKPFSIQPTASSTPTTPTTPTTSRPTLRYGDSGDDVRYLQERLRQLNYDVVIDGYFGHETRERVERLQEDNGLAPNGVVGPETWGVLEQR